MVGALPKERWRALRVVHVEDATPDFAPWQREVVPGARTREVTEESAGARVHERHVRRLAPWAQLCVGGANIRTHRA